MTHQPLALQICERFDRFCDRSFRRPMNVEHDPQVDDVERLKPKIAQVIMDGTRQFCGAKGRMP